MTETEVKDGGFFASVSFLNKGMNYINIGIEKHVSQGLYPAGLLRYLDSL